jgi:diguanylate cyclase (GGDEF)-like protein/PAS domain S-box-containing protein
MPVDRCRRLVHLLFLVLPGLVWLAPASARDEAAGSPGLPQHALEIEALQAPEKVLGELPGRIRDARARGDSHELALLLLAQANACRVIADWPCQRIAGAGAADAARAAGEPILRVRALIAESRATIAMQDFTRGEQLLGQAEVLLSTTPSPELSADVYLAYSSLSYSLGKHALSGEYAQRGLKVLPPGRAEPMRARLLRNLARSQAQQGQSAEADATLVQAQLLAERFDDPKLSAELLLESARMARLAGNIAAQVKAGEKVLALGSRLKNSQLYGMGHEVLGLAALDAGNRAEALAQLDLAWKSFRSLGQKRDETRVLRQLVRLSIELKRPRAELDEMTRRFLTIDDEIESNDRAKAADDFDARLQYAQREMEVLRLNDEAALAREREKALALSNQQTRRFGLLVAAVLVVLAVFYALQRRTNQRLRRTLALLRESEARSRDLLDLSAGFVFLHDLRGQLLLVNPATAQALGQPADLLVGRALQEFQPRAGRQDFADYLARVQAASEDEGVFLIRSADGDHRHWRYSSRLSAPQDGRAYVVGNAVDVTDQVQHTQALHERSLRDALTGAYNRRHLEVFEQEQGTQPWAAITVDLDHFKQVNDTQGHDRGDQVLIEFAHFLSARVREADSVVRLGGDEFLVLLAGADLDTLRSTAGRLGLDAAAAPCAFTFGSALREPGEALSSTIARADAAMYATRASERGAAAQPRE